jgi:hypothetical protein
MQEHGEQKKRAMLRFQFSGVVYENWKKGAGRPRPKQIVFLLDDNLNN